MKPSEYEEVNDVINHLKASVKLHAGNRSSRYAAYENTAIWIASMELGLVKRGDGRSKYRRTKLTTGVTTEEMTVPLPKDEDEKMADAAEDNHAAMTPRQSKS